jgi:ATP-dependent RNA helicase DDX35
VTAVIKVDKECSGEAGDILVFLPGKPEIDRATDLLTAEPETRHLYPLALHGSLSMTAQMAVFQSAPRGFKRRVIFATNVAETSLTIPDIRFVIDSGLVKRRVFQPASGTHKMVLCKISKSSARQRAGRAGRTRPGRVFRLYTQEEYEEMADFSPSEMELCDFTSQLLQLKAIGIRDPISFGFLTPPPRSHVAAAKLALRALGAINDQDELTPDYGVPMAELPVDPALGRMLMASKQYGCTANILNIVSMLSVGDIFLPGTEYEVKRKQAVEEGDLLTLHNIYLAFQQNRANAANWAPRHGLIHRNLEKAEKLRALLSGQLRHYGLDTKTESAEDEPVLKCIFAGLFMNLAECQSDGSYRLVRDQSPSPQALFMHPDSMLFKRIPDWVVFTEALQTTKMFIRNVSVVEKAWIAEVAPHYFSMTFR